MSSICISVIPLRQRIVLCYTICLQSTNKASLWRSTSETMTYNKGHHNNVKDTRTAGLWDLSPCMRVIRGESTPPRVSVYIYIRTHSKGWRLGEWSLCALLFLVTMPCNSYCWRQSDSLLLCPSLFVIRFIWHRLPSTTVTDPSLCVDCALLLFQIIFHHVPLEVSCRCRCQWDKVSGSTRTVICFEVIGPKTLIFFGG